MQAKIGKVGTWTAPPTDDRGAQANQQNRASDKQARARLQGPGREIDPPQGKTAKEHCSDAAISRTGALKDRTAALGQRRIALHCRTAAA